jgi:hypothetical protein
MVEVFLEIEKYFLLTKCPDFENRDWLIKNWNNVTAKSMDGRLHYSASRGRRSGDLWTSLFNTLLNFLVTMFVYNFTWDSDFRVMALGDDNVVSTNEDVDVNEALNKYEGLGMKIEIIPRLTMSETSFCSGIFWKVGGKYVWGNLPFRTIAKLGINHHNHHEKNFSGLLYGSAKSMLPSAGHVPVLGSLLRAIVRSAESKNIKIRRDNRGANPYKIHGGFVLEPEGDTIKQFAERYGLDVDTVIMLDQQLSKVNIDQFPLKIFGDVFDDCVATDVGAAGSDSVSLEQLLYDVPYAEEHEKLAGCTNILDAISNAIDFGKEEVAEGAPDVNIFLHALFTSIAWFNIDWAINMHSWYNLYAVYNGLTPCRRKKNKGRSNKGQQKTAKSTIKKIVKESLIMAGTLGGEYLGGPAGGVVGAKAGAWLSKISGMGDYHVRANSLYHSQTVPAFGKQTVKIRHREYIGDITGSTSFSVVDYDINPGMRQTFPWLSNMANMFEQYKIKGLIFEFISTAGTAVGSTNTALGTVVMATQYNVYKPQFTSKIEMENHEFSVSGAPYNSLIHPVECDPSETPYNVHFVRNSSLADNEDERLYDWGRFTVATVGMQAANVIGELWVSYDIEFEKPRIAPNAYPNPLHARLSNGAWDEPDTLGDILRGVGGNLPVTVSSYSGGYSQINFPSWVYNGRFMVVVCAQASANFTDKLHVDTEVNCEIGTTGYGFDLDTLWQFDATVADDRSVFVTFIDVLDTGASFVVDTSSTSAVGTSVDVYIFQVPAADQFEILTDSVAFESYKKMQELLLKQRRYDMIDDAKEAKEDA